MRMHQSCVHPVALVEYKTKTMGSAATLRSHIEAPLADRIPSALTPAAKTIRERAAQSGQAGWLNVRPPLRPATLADGTLRLARLDALMRQRAA